MPVQEHRPLIEHEPLRRENQVLEDQLHGLHRASDRVYTLRSGRQEAATNLEVLRQNHPHYAQREFGRVAGYILIAFMGVAIYVIDVLLFSPVAEFISRLAFGDSALLLNVMRFLVPAMIIAIEIGLSILIYRAREEMRELGEVGTFNMWLLAGIIFAVAVPVLVIATTMAATEMLDGSDSYSLFLLIGLVVLSLIPHAAVIFGGRLAHDGKAYLLYRWDERKYLKQLRAFDRDLPVQERNVRDTFSRYYQRLNQLNNQYAHARITPGPFTNPTRSLVNELFGYEVIAAPPGGNGQPRPSNGAVAVQHPQENEATHPAPIRNAAPVGGNGTQQPAENTNDAGGGPDEADYLRTILHHRMNENDGEVQP